MAGGMIAEFDELIAAFPMTRKRARKKVQTSSQCEIGTSIAQAPATARKTNPRR